VESIVVDGTNAFRASEGLKPVEGNASLQAAARSFAHFMAQSGKYGHEVDGSTPAARAKRQGYDYCIVSENIAYRFDSRDFTTHALAGEFLEGWKQSPGHRRNMLEPWVTETAVAVVEGPRSGYYYAVQMFGRPNAIAIRFKVRNDSRSPVRYRVGDETFVVTPGATRTHTECREETLVLDAPGAEGSRVVVHNDDDFVITGERGRVALRRE
ncbi:MAG: CAP domain-containing protein, partial [Usitatibacter sp.]